MNPISNAALGELASKIAADLPDDDLYEIRILMRRVEGGVEVARYFVGKFDGQYDAVMAAINYPDILDLMTAQVPPGTYATCRAYGAIKFGDGKLDDQLTADIVNTGAGMFLPPEETETVIVEPMFTDEAAARAAVVRRTSLEAPPKDRRGDQTGEPKTARDVLTEQIVGPSPGASITDADAESIIKELYAAGFEIVPKEPTEAMIAAAEAACKRHDVNVDDPFWMYAWVKDRAPVIYRAMIAAAETQP